jgi:hypothetical protein
MESIESMDLFGTDNHIWIVWRGPDCTLALIVLGRQDNRFFSPRCCEAAWSMQTIASKSQGTVVGEQDQDSVWSKTLVKVLSVLFIVAVVPWLLQR